MTGSDGESAAIEQLDLEDLRREYRDLREAHFSGLLDEDERQRMEDAWRELRVRTDVQQPECPECGARNWVFTDHTECWECGYGLSMGDEDLLGEVQAAWNRITVGGGESA